MVIPLAWCPAVSRTPATPQDERAALPCWQPLDKKICDEVADAAMGQAYAALPKEAPDPEIRAMLANSQRRWIAARNDGLEWRCHSRRRDTSRHG
jgi:uncharacterized protein YecT (DUF1311 family)